jgi:NADH-quinone oxidoreductase subunit L
MGLGFDWLYDRLFVSPVVWLSEIDKEDFIDLFYSGIAAVTGFMHSVMTRTQTGRLRWYVMAISIGVVLVVTIILYL